MLTIGGAVTITTIQQRERTTVLTDEGATEPALTITGLISRRSHSTLALARVAERQLHEFAHWWRVAGGVHVDSSEFDVDDGLYEVRNVSTRTEPATGVSHGITVSLTLRRLGGTGPGGNATRRLLPTPTLNTNNFSVTSTPFQALPVGASSHDIVASASPGSADGTMGLMASSSPQTYFHDAADYNKGECKVWDTGGSATASDWVRVFGPDHVFASAAHCAIDNGLVRLTPIVASPGRHAVAVWTGAAWTTITDSNGDAVTIGGNAPSAWLSCRIRDITPWRVEVEWPLVPPASPWFPVKRLTLERGRMLAKLVLSAETSAQMGIGIVGSSNGLSAVIPTETQLTAAAARAHALDSGAATLNAVTVQPALMTVTHGGTAMGLLVAASTSGTDWKKSSLGGIELITTTTASSFTVWIGGLAYDAAKLAVEAEAATLVATAAITTISGASGGGSNNCVSLPAVSDAVRMAAHRNPPAGTTVLGIARVQNAGTSSSDSIQMQIYNVTAGAALTGSEVGVQASTLGSGGTWKYTTVIGTGWNGTDNIELRVTRSAAGGGGAIYVDRGWLLTIGNGGYKFARDIGRAALTEVLVRAQTIRRVR